MLELLQKNFDLSSICSLTRFQTHAVLVTVSAYSYFFQSLIFVALPYREDLRYHQFAPLVGGKNKPPTSKNIFFQFYYGKCD